MTTLTPENARRIIDQLAVAPHAAALGFTVDVGEDGDVIVSIPYDKRLIGDPSTGVIHGGVVTTLLDSGCGLATLLKLGGKIPVATLDLRIDYMRPSKPGAAIRAACECYHLTRSVAFCRGVAFDEDRSDPVAAAAAAFMFTAPEDKR